MLNKQPVGAEKDGQQGQPPPPDVATFGAVKATQYGAFDRLRELVETEGVDVNMRDEEDVVSRLAGDRHQGTLSAIVNRSSLGCNFYLFNMRDDEDVVRDRITVISRGK